jgi:transcriptional regulator with XRE-family HTH domain
MDRSERGAILKKLRESKNERQSEIAKIVGVTQQAYQRYENGTSEPNADGLIVLANHFNVTVDYLLGRESEKNPIAMLNLAIGEKEALDLYCKLPENIRQIIMDTMIQLGEAAKRGMAGEPKIIVFKRFSVHKVSAGCGYDLEDADNWEDLEVVDTPEAQKADFAVEIDGRSMEPTYQNGDIVYVVSDTDVPVGKIGLFIQNNKGYIKEKGNDRLISHNDEYPDIYPEDGEIICVGRVIGTAELPQ